MRVIAGSARRLRLVTPEGMDTRPTQDIIKETLFNILQMDVPGAVFVDICAGSGQIGIEALSRGARRAYFIENSKAAYSCIQKNIHATHLEDKSILLRQDAVGALHQIHEKEVDLIYMDPPYASDIVQSVMHSLARMPYVTDRTQIIIESSKTTDFSFLEDIGFQIVREKDYRKNRHLFVKRVEREG